MTLLVFNKISFGVDGVELLKGRGVHPDGGIRALFIFLSFLMLFVIAGLAFEIFWCIVKGKWGFCTIGHAI